MTILFWLIFRLLLIVTAIYLALYLIRLSNPRESWEIIVNGIKEGLRGSGLIIPKKTYTVELYKWVPLDEHEACEDCRERARWEPMDIADWMKVGLPRTHEANTQCGEDCKCELILHKKSTVPSN